MPLISIGMPVFNSEHTIEKSIRSLLSQDFKDFELIISDNGSTDDTPNICQYLSSQDSRIRYFRYEKNRGASWNFKNVFTLASSEFFMWAASHDMWESNYINSCIEKIKTNPKICLVYSQLTWFKDDNILYSPAVSLIDTQGKSTIMRLWDIIFKLSMCDMVYGVFRSSELKKCRIGLSCQGPDNILLFELSLYGEIAVIHQRGFLRYIPDRVFRSLEEEKIDYLTRIDPDFEKRRVIRPITEMSIQHIHGLLKSKLSIVKKILFLLPIIMLLSIRRGRKIIHEIFHPIIQHQ